MAAGIEPFRVEVADAVLADLQERLDRARLPDEVEAAGWDYGTPLDLMGHMCRYWREVYDWRAAEAELNRWPQFVTEVDGERIHFMHVRSRSDDAFPLVLTHGWPGSVVEFLKVLGPLTDPVAFGGSASDAFHVVCPSIPGYAFSGPTRSRGMNVPKVASMIAEVMSRLGYSRYGAQGGDWGAAISRQLGLDDADHVAAIHLNMLMAPLPREASALEGLTESERAALAGMDAVRRTGMGYMHIQRTRPQTLAYGLNDSPVGLAAWILEKFRAWSDCGGDPLSVFTRDELLTNVMVYWVTGTIGSSARLYYENHAHRQQSLARVAVPTGCAVYPGEIFRPPRRWVEPHYDIVHWAEQPRGGHFAAFEVPDLFVDDVRTFFRLIR